MNFSKLFLCKGIVLLATLAAPLLLWGQDGNFPKRKLPVKPSHTEVDTTINHAQVLYVKFQEGLNIKEQNGELVGISANQEVLQQGTWSRLHHVSEGELERMRVTAMRNLKKEVADPNLEFTVRFPAGYETGRMADALNALTDVEIALPMPKAIVPPLPADYTPLQQYQNSSNTGIYADAVWQQYNNRGNGIRVGNIEYSYNAQHEDLPPITYVGPQAPDPFNDDNHGTATFGVIGSLDNGWGTTGTVSDATFFFSNANDMNGFHNVSGAITSMLTALEPGDVMLLEQQFAGPNYDSETGIGLVPVDWYLPFYNSIVLAVGQNVTVVQTAGNGGQNLDDPIYSTGNYGHYPFLSQNNSGAIMVGAGASLNGSDVSRSRLFFSNYGSRLDLQGWGENVATTGYGALFSLEGPNRYFTNQFNGTSSAGPVVTGAAALLQSVNKAYGNAPLSSIQVRDILVATGHPQQSGTYSSSQKIGPLPNALAAIQQVVGTPDPVGTLSSPASVCLGEQIDITGTNPLNAEFFSYQVFAPGATAWEEIPFQTSPNLSFTPNANGTYQLVRFTWWNNAWQGPTVIEAVEVQTITPTLSISGPTASVCQGENITINATATGQGNSPQYQWTVNGSPAGTGAETLSSNVFQNGDVVTCTLVSSEACASPQSVSSNSFTVSIAPSVSPTISISGPTASICEGDNITITAAATGQGSSPQYLWTVNGSPAGPGTATLSSNVFQNGDLVTCTLVSSEACASPQSVSSNSFTVSIGEIPDVTANAMNGTVCAGTAATVFGSGAVSYAWSHGIQDGQEFFPEATAWYVVTGTSADGCTSVDSVLIEIDICVGLMDKSTTVDLTLSPNPAYTEITLTLHGAGADDGIQDVVIMDAVGRSVMVSTTQRSSSRMTLDVKGLAPGSYVVQVRCRTHRITRRLFKL